MTQAETTPRTERLMRHGQAPLVGILVLARDGRDDTLECLSSIYELEYPCAIVAVVDDGSRDMTADVIGERYPEIHVIRNTSPLGAAVSYNQAMRWAFAHGADYVLLIQHRTQVESNVLHRLVDTAQQCPRAGLLGPTICGTENPSKTWFTGLRFDSPAELLDRRLADRMVSASCPTHVDYVSRCAMLVTRRLYETVGGFPTDRTDGYRDLDYCITARRADFDILYVPHARLWYADDRPFRLEPSRSRLRDRLHGWIALARRHFRGRARIRLIARGLTRIARSR